MTATNTDRAELLSASDEEIADALQYTDPIVLRSLLYQLTGDEQLKSLSTTRVAAGMGQATVIESEDDVATLRRKAAEFLIAYRDSDSGAGPIDIGPADRLRGAIDLMAGAEVDDDSMAIYLEELGIDPWARELKWSEQPDPEKLQGFSVTVIGSGLGGLNVALMLKRAGIPYTHLEKNDGVGGTWHENRYPGARVDTPSRGYTHIFGADFGYPYAFCPWTENQRYFDWVADSFDLRDHITFNTEVLSLVWDDRASMWEIEVDGPDGKQTMRSNAVITAVGFLNRPRIPEIEGMLEFAGPSWHTARWPADFDPKGKKIAVIGTGCTGYQTTPELALEAEHVALFQRTPSWMFPAQGYRSLLPEQSLWLDRNFPFYLNFVRLRMSTGLGAWDEMTDIDPDFDDPHAVSPFNKVMRDSSVAFLERKLGDPELVAKMTPPHPPWSQRPVIVDPDYSVLDAIQRDNVTLVTDGVRRVTRTGVQAQDGTNYDADAIVYATGFHATEYLFPMGITGRNGRTVEKYWADGGARAYRFSMIPGFPNLWSLYGPNTNGGLGPGSFHELVTQYALRCIERLILEDKKSIDANEDAYWRYNEEVDERGSIKVWSDPRANNYYWTDHGRSAVMCPFAAPKISQLLRNPDWSEMEIR